MIKQTLYFGNPVYLSLRKQQMVINLLDVSQQKDLPQSLREESVITRPIEDIGLVILDNKRITITQGLLAALLENNCAVITCDNNCMPIGLQLPLTANTIQSERFKLQIEATKTLRKRLWQLTVQRKIVNQAACLAECIGESPGCMSIWATKVRSGDSTNLEGRAAAFYWKNIFSKFEGLKNFTRGREGLPPNNLLNYGYAILRAVIARSLVGSGLLPTFGIHHSNRYNAYCLADDVMEPYRPYVDKLVYKIIKKQGVDNLELTKSLKAQLLSIPTLDVVINGKRSPLMVAATTTTASLVKCFSGEQRIIAYPDMTK